MTQPIGLSVYEIVGSGLCVASDDGMKVYERLSKALGQERYVELSFMNVDTLTSAFLNAAIGQLYGDFAEEKIEGLIQYTDITPEDKELLNIVKNNAKEYFEDLREQQKATQNKE